MLRYGLCSTLSSAFPCTGSGRQPVQKANPYVAFGSQWILNAAWTPVFFGFQSLAGGVILLLVLMVAIVWTMAVFAHIDRLSTWLLVPYACWAGFALYLNAALLVLNPQG